jgi:hypothetical protein
MPRRQSGDVDDDADGAVFLDEDRVAHGAAVGILELGDARRGDRKVRDPNERNPTPGSEDPSGSDDRCNVP